MDLLFKRYANPFILMDQYIKSRRLLKFIDDLIINYNEDEIYRLWLHKVYNKNYVDFKKEIDDQIKAMSFTKEQKNSVIENSKNILENFKPQEGGV